MKIAIPADEKSLESGVCPSFGRAPYFLIYDTETNESEFIDNSAAASQGGAGVKAGQTIVDSKARALITPRCGENAAMAMHAANIKIYKSIEGSIIDNINALTQGKLSILEEIHPGFHGHHGGN